MIINLTTNLTKWNMSCLDTIYRQFAVIRYSDSLIYNHVTVVFILYLNVKAMCNRGAKTIFLKTKQEVKERKVLKIAISHLQALKREQLNNFLLAT